MLFAFDEHCVYLSPAPSYHAAPLRFVLASQSLGGTAVLMDRFDPGDSWPRSNATRSLTRRWCPRCSFVC